LSKIGDKDVRVYFSVNGHGLGHISRCISIAQRLERIGADVLFSTYCEGLDYAKSKKLPFVESPSIGYDVGPEGEVDVRSTLANPKLLSTIPVLNQVNAELRYIGRFRPDVVVSDSRASSILAARLLGITVITILNQYQVIIPRRKRFLRLARVGDGALLTLVGRIWMMSRELLIPDFPPPFTVSLRNLKIPPSRKRKVEFIGPILPVRPEDLPEKKKLRRKLGLPNDKPVIFAPISGPRKEKTPFIRSLLASLKRVETEYEIVVSLGFPDGSSYPVKDGGCTVYQWLPNHSEFLKACDLVISRPGHTTLMEAICFHKPLLLIPTPNHTEQQGNAARASELGIAEVLSQESITSANLKSHIELMLMTDDYKRKLEEIERKVPCMDGAEAAVNAVVMAA